MDAGAFFRAREDGVARVETDDVLDLASGLVWLCPRQVDLVDDRDDLEVVLDRQVRIGERLRLDALRSVDEQQRALARRQRPGHLVGKVDVPRRVDQVEDIHLPVVGLVGQPDRVRLDGDAALALEVHAVEDLRLHLPRLERPRHLEKTVRQRRLAVVDVGDDGEVADVALIHVGGNSDYSSAFGARRFGGSETTAQAQSSRDFLERSNAERRIPELEPRLYRCSSATNRCGYAGPM